MLASNLRWLVHLLKQLIFSCTSGLNPRCSCHYHYRIESKSFPKPSLSSHWINFLNCLNLMFLPPSIPGCEEMDNKRVNYRTSAYPPALNSLLFWWIHFIIEWQGRLVEMFSSEPDSSLLPFKNRLQETNLQQILLEISNNLLFCEIFCSQLNG